MTTSVSSTSTDEGRTRRCAVPGRGKMFGAVAMVVVGSFMPWLDTAFGTVSGAGGPGLWTFYAAMLGLAAAMVPVRTLRLLQGLLFATVALAIPLWQVVHLLLEVGTEAWMPGPGLVLVVGGGVLAGAATLQMHRSS